MLNNSQITHCSYVLENKHLNVADADSKQPKCTTIFESCQNYLENCNLR